ncbi:MAG TPA: nucleoside kinase [Caproiciproducens sp.]|nr:nucleoside kinase [Caproiciproducens sp.]
MVSFVEYKNELSWINDSACASPESFVKETEEAFHKNLRSIAKKIKEAKGGSKLVLLFGPSSSGKTTTSHLLQTALNHIGIGSTIISLDDFYRGESQAPLLPNGQHDYESVQALNIPEIEKCLLGLLQKNSCDMPLFNFEVRKPYPYRRHVELEENDIAIVEGIHALNPVITQNLPDHGVRKIYISVKQGIRDDRTELFNANDMRLIRRIVRDFNFRGTDPERTLRMWPDVMDGERKYIKPFRSEVDYTINSLHLYETCVLKDQAISILKKVPQQCGQYEFAQKLIGNLSVFESIDCGLVPKDSILREFIGGGEY